MPEEKIEKEKPMESSGEKVSFNDFLTSMAGGTVEPKVEETPAKAEPTGEQSTETPPVETPVVETPELKEQEDTDEDREPLPGTEVSAKVPEEKPAKVARDYTGIDEKHKPLFEKMGNEAFAFNKQLYIEHRQQKAEIEKLKKAPPTTPGKSVYGHERAYILDDNYGQLVGAVNLTSQIAKHWNTQLAEIRRTGKFQDATVQNGRLLVSAPREATAQDEADVIEHIEHANAQKNGVLQEYNKFVSEYENSYKGDLQKLNDGMAEHFPDSVRPELKKMEDEVIQKWIPKSFQDHPVTRLWAYTVFELAKALKQNQDKSKVEKRVEATNKTAAETPPTKAKLGAGAGTSNGMPKFSDFQNRMQEA